MVDGVDEIHAKDLKNLGSWQLSDDWYSRDSRLNPGRYFWLFSGVGWGVRKGREGEGRGKGEEGRDIRRSSMQLSLKEYPSN